MPQPEELLGRLGADHPLIVTDSGVDDQGVGTITLVTRDSPGLFSAITGILGARGFNVLAGTVTTDSEGYAEDTFRGVVQGNFTQWVADVEAELCRILAPLYREIPDPDAVRNAVMEEVARAHRRRRQVEVEAGSASAPAAGSPSVPQDQSEPLLPIEISLDDEETTTRITVTSQDTPFFLYSLSSALAMQEISIRAVEIDTRDDRIRDVFHVTRNDGQVITNQEERRRLQLSILVTKQFSHSLGGAADPKGAFTRFEELVHQVIRDRAGDQIRHLLADPDAQRDLARLLGASDFLWEDFIRLQYEAILPLLADQTARRLISTPSEELEAKLEQQLSHTQDLEEQRRILNRFKDHESYLVDVDHILKRNSDFFFLSHRLTRLAEVVVRAAYRIAWREQTRRFGIPRTAAGLATDYAVFGLGKLGGSALGYASDIELMTVYSDHGSTDGDGTTDGAASPDETDRKSITNREFFERLVQSVSDLIEARREGIFQIDLRLRPYGNDGPRAVHLETFITYYGAGGDAHSAERLALIRLRPIGGDPDLGRRVIEIRDQMLYQAQTIDIAEIRDLRRRQVEEKTAGEGRLNAKMSPGALVDLEYNVQLLQVAHGGANRQLRNPGIHATLMGLSEAGTIDPQEAEGMIRAYRFLRSLINGLRMLRGNAQDLFLPEYNTVEFLHLARRMGYEDSSELNASDQLRVDFEVETAAVRGFVERHMGLEALPQRGGGNPADLVLSDTLSEEVSAGILTAAGFRNPARGIINLRRMASRGDKETFARLLVLAWDYLRRSDDPDMALNNWERFTEQVTDRQRFFHQLLAQPRRMEIMLKIFAGSRFLAETLIRDPVFLEWISDPAVIAEPRDEKEMTRELQQMLDAEPDRLERLNTMRRFRRREILRIGTRDICLGEDFREVVREISALARAVVDQAYLQVQREIPGRLSILAFGKLGGDELNYSSDIDLLAVYESTPGEENQEQQLGRLFRQVVRDLSDHTRDGQAYRVDLRLRPWGNAGRLVYSTETLYRYYRDEAELWELQAAIKLAPIAGDRELGAEVMRQLERITSARLQTAGRERIVATVRQLRQRAVTQYHDESSGADVKNGEGGIRDIEFLVQALQMLHHTLYPHLMTGNTLLGLRHLEEAGILDTGKVTELREDYQFLRRIEHFLQVYDDQQLHAIPTEPEAQGKLARLVLGPDGKADALQERLRTTLTRVRREYDRRVRAAGEG